MATTQWTDFEGLKKMYEKDWDIVQNLDKSITKAEHIKEHVLPQFEELYNNHNKFFPQKLAYKRMIDYLNGLLLELGNYDNSISTIKEQETPKTFIANEYALAYIFDLDANGKQIPTNRIEGGYSKKEIIQIGFELYQIDKNKDTFYRAVKYVADVDRNKRRNLVNISTNWFEAVKALSKDWNKTQEYLRKKELIGE